jgi:FKBP-type peptidyl-prolyl cis-trans isomerase
MVFFLKHRKCIPVLWFCAALISACSAPTPPAAPKPLKVNQEKLEEELVRLNRLQALEESWKIRRYIYRQGWDMTPTGTGVYIRWIAPPKTGPKPQTNDEVLIDFEIFLLEGTSCYSSFETGPEWFRVDHDQVESGMHEAIKFLSEGDHVAIIIPSHMAFGLAGDMEKIPGNTPVLYHLELLRIQSKKP